MARTNTPKYLERMKSGAYRVSIPVPKHLQEALKKTRIKKALDTHSVAEASERSHAVIHEVISFLNKVENGSIPSPTSARAIASAWSDNDLTEIALEMRQDLERHTTGTDAYEQALEAIQITADSLRGDLIGIDVDDHLQEEIAVYDEKRQTKSAAFHALATGRSTPADIKVDTFLSLMKWNARTKKDFERAFGLLRDWCHQKKVNFKLENINRKTASLFVEHLASNEERKLTNRTINKYVSSINQYWHWLEKRDYLAANEASPWIGQTLAKDRVTEDERERPFTDEEITRLFSKLPPQSYLRDAMAIGALTGARLDAIICLKRKDITEDKCFRFKPQKKENASRKVPIHSALTSLVARLGDGKGPEEDLFPECPPVNDATPQERSSPASKAFTRFRRSVEVMDAVEGKRRDRVNFHSFRRWFITKAYQAKIPEVTIQRVVGHKPQSVTAGVYLGDLTVDQLRECVEAVQLPAAVPL
jgi:integrase